LDFCLPCLASYQHPIHGHLHSSPPSPGVPAKFHFSATLGSGSSAADETQRQSLWGPVTYTGPKGKQRATSTLISGDFSKELPGQKRKRGTEPDESCSSSGVESLGEPNAWHHGVKKLKPGKEKLLDSIPATRSFPIRSKDSDVLSHIMEDDLVNSYIKLVHETTSLKSQKAMLENMPWYFPKIGDDSRIQLQAQMDADLLNATERMQEVRKFCWQEGYSVDEIDVFINSFPRDVSTNELGDGTTSSIAADTTAEGGGHDLQGSTQRIEAGTWPTKRDRINFWMLSNLQASKERLQQHRRIYQETISELQRIKMANSITSLTSPPAQSTDESSTPKILELAQLNDKAYGRMVLKYWPLDEAATGYEARIASTNGAVDSEGMMCEFRVVLRDV